MNNAKVKSFTASNDIIRHFIFSQAGSIEKALMELVMNEIDAKGTRVDIYFEGNSRLIVSGNGVGFQSEAEVDALFSVFGFDHNTDTELARDRTYGAFGLGRAQIFAFGKCRWLTNHCEMLVDMQTRSDDHDLPYLFTEHATLQHPGCRIEIDLYKPMAPHDRAFLQRSLRENLKYAPSEIWFENVLMNTPYQQSSWKAASEHLVFQPSPSAGLLRVYNCGIFVRSFPMSKFGVGGVVTSTIKPFKLNVARNDIITSDCPLYAEMATLLKPFAEKKAKFKMNETERDSYIRRYIQGEIAPEEFFKARLFPSAKGAERSLNMIIKESNGQIAIMGDKYSFGTSKAESLQRISGVLVMENAVFSSFEIPCPQTGHQFGSYKNPSYNVEDLAVLSKALKDIVIAGAQVYNAQNDNYPVSYIEHVYGQKINQLTLLDADALQAEHEAGQESEYQTLPKADYTKTQKVLVAVVEKMQRKIAAQCSRYLRNSKQIDNDAIMNRAVRLSAKKQVSMLAWTDSRSYIAYNQSYLQRCADQGVNGFLALALTMVHELMHVREAGEKPDEQSHSFDFYRNCEEVTHQLFHFGGMYQICIEATRQYFKGREAAGLSTLSLALRCTEVDLDAKSSELVVDGENQLDSAREVA